MNSTTIVNADEHAVVMAGPAGSATAYPARTSPLSQVPNANTAKTSL